MEKKLARALSLLLHPLLMPCYILALMLSVNNYTQVSIPFYYKFLMFSVVLLMTVLLPLSFTWFLLRLKMVNSLFMTTKEERTYPLLAMAVFYYATYFLLKDIPITLIFSYYMLGATLVAIIILILNFYRMTSLHMAGIGSFTGLFLGLTLNYKINFLPEIIAGILLAGIIGYARLKENAHQPADIYTGFLTGALTLGLLSGLL